MSLSARAIAAIAVLVSLSGCQSPASTPTLATVAVRPVVTTESVAPAGEDTSAILSRFTTAIWPAMVDYHFHRAQNAPANLRWIAVIAGPFEPADYSALRQAVFDLGEITPDAPEAGSAGIEGLALVSARVSAATDTAATVSACYTFTALTTTIASGSDPIRTPAAAEADFGLVRTDTWYLRSITGQQAVQTC